MSVEALIFCDRCGVLVASAKNAVIARQELKEDGGATRYDTKGRRRDFCTECNRRKKR